MEYRRELLGGFNCLGCWFVGVVRHHNVVGLDPITHLEQLVGWIHRLALLVHFKSRVVEDDLYVWILCSFLDIELDVIVMLFDKVGENKMNWSALDQIEMRYRGNVCELYQSKILS